MTLNKFNGLKCWDCIRQCRRVWVWVGERCGGWVVDATAQSQAVSHSVESGPCRTMYITSRRLLCVLCSSTGVITAFSTQVELFKCFY